jgi:hypothetical protein
MKTHYTAIPRTELGFGDGTVRNILDWLGAEGDDLFG